MTNVAKKLIEVAMPIKEISAESVRDKSIRHGHISTLHLWWARRPLPVCRAVVFASLVPDPDDEHCPPQFRQAVEMLLGNQQGNPQGNPQGDPYKPYDDIPWTPVYEPHARYAAQSLANVHRQIHRRYAAGAQAQQKNARCQ